MSARYVVGIDLGTTHCALASAEIGDEGARPEVFAVRQLIAQRSTDTRTLLPSFIYFAHDSEGACPLPWDAERSFAVGEHARTRAAEAPLRVVSSAKSWLSHTGIDRRDGCLPPHAPEDVEKISPVEASFRYLDHLAEAWEFDLARGAGDSALASQEVVLTVPASFDAAARELTVEAAYAAGMENVTLLEEPQAALYSWIDAVGDDWRRLLGPGDVVLVVDIGGGTTDFSAMTIEDRDGTVELSRIAVGDHILLGGDNIDLGLAHALKVKLETGGASVDSAALQALTHTARAAKEALLSDANLSSVPVTIAGRGSQLLGNTLRTELSGDEVRALVLDGFLPVVGAADHPRQRPKVGLRQIGLPYADDPAITRHLAAFLTRQAGAVRSPTSESRPLLCPTRVLFNGGVTKAPAVRERVLSVLGQWLAEVGAPAPTELPAADLDLAVARGAAYYGLVRRGRGLRIRGGTAQAYYVGIESPAPAVPGVEPPVVAVCVAPFGLEEGSPSSAVPMELGLVVGEKVRFRFFASSVRRLDGVGACLERWSPSELRELAPIEIELPAEGRRVGDVVPVRISASATEIGTLALDAVPLSPLAADERWKVELSVRGS